MSYNQSVICHRDCRWRSTCLGALCIFTLEGQLLPHGQQDVRPNFRGWINSHLKFEGKQFFVTHVYNPSDTLIKTGKAPECLHWMR